MRTLNEILKEDYDAIDEEAIFEEVLDCEGTVSILGGNYYPSTILKECDPIAYRTYLSDFLGNEGEFIEVEGKYYFTDEHSLAVEDYEDQLKEN